MLSTLTGPLYILGLVVLWAFITGALSAVAHPLLAALLAALIVTKVTAMHG